MKKIKKFNQLQKGAFYELPSFGKFVKFKGMRNEYIAIFIDCEWDDDCELQETKNEIYLTKEELHLLEEL